MTNTMVMRQFGSGLVHTFTDEPTGFDLQAEAAQRRKDLKQMRLRLRDQASASELRAEVATRRAKYSPTRTSRMTPPTTTTPKRNREREAAVVKAFLAARG